MTIKKGDHISFKVGSESWKRFPLVCEVSYVSEGCKDMDCGHDDCWREPYVVFRPCSYSGEALADVATVFKAGERYGRPFNGG